MSDYLNQLLTEAQSMVIEVGCLKAKQFSDGNAKTEAIYGQICRLDNLLHEASGKLGIEFPWSELHSLTVIPHLNQGTGHDLSMGLFLWSKGFFEKIKQAVKAAVTRDDHPYKPFAEALASYLDIFEEFLQKKIEPLYGYAQHGSFKQLQVEQLGSGQPSSSLSKLIPNFCTLT